MQVSELVEVGNGLSEDQDVVGYFALGHQDKAAFCQAVDEQYGDYDETLKIKHDFVEHLLYTIAEDKSFIFSKEVGQPITVWQ